MHLIKVNAINSTNSYAREMFKEKSVLSPVCVVARRQLQGRGQRGTVWASNAGQNLTFSILYPEPGISASQQFLLSATVATAIVKQLSVFGIPKLKLKWPNDIMAANSKIGGILIENIIADGKMAASVIGVGLNVNQTNFEGLPAAGSMKLATGIHFDLDEVLTRLLEALEVEIRRLGSRTPGEIMAAYKEHLFRYRVPSTFQLPDLSLFTGIIEDVSQSGKLRVRSENEEIREFDLKEVKLCF